MSLLTISPQYEVVMLHVSLIVLPQQAPRLHHDWPSTTSQLLYRRTDCITLYLQLNNTQSMTTCDNTKCLINRRSVTNSHFKHLKRSLGQTVQSNDIILGLSCISRMMVHRPKHVAVNNKLVPPSKFTSGLLLQSYLCANIWV
jgi:hypothetical protein